jgi:hypothetical protein
VALGGREVNFWGVKFLGQAAFGKNGRLVVIAVVEVSVDLSSECPRAGEARVDMEPKTHGDKVAFVRWSGRSVEEYPMALE